MLEEKLYSKPQSKKALQYFEQCSAFAILFPNECTLIFAVLWARTSFACNCLTLFFVIGTLFNWYITAGKKKIHHHDHDIASLQLRTISLSVLRTFVLATFHDISIINVGISRLLNKIKYKQEYYFYVDVHTYLPDLY